MEQDAEAAASERNLASCISSRSCALWHRKHALRDDIVCCIIVPMGKIRRAAIVLLFLFLLFPSVSCIREQSDVIAVIGGADGPTSIYVE